MTPEEAIRVIEVAKAECEWNAPLDYQTAFNMAISALKNSPTSVSGTSDAISRQDAIGLEYIVTTINGVDYVMLSEVQMKLRKLPSAEPKRERIKWIPHKSVFGGPGERVYTCDKCGYNIGFHVENFCPNCGGKYKG